jgi:type IV pilus assembly protein PilA
MNSLNKEKNNKGFSLIELLVVVAIIGILAAVGVVAYSGYTASAKVNTVKTQHADIAKYMGAEFQKCNIGVNTIFLNTGGVAGGTEVGEDCTTFGTTTTLATSVADALRVTFKNSYQGAFSAFADGSTIASSPNCSNAEGALPAGLSGCHDLTYNATTRQVTLYSIHDDPNVAGGQLVITTVIRSE